MDVFKSPYYIHIYRMLSFHGHWPDQSFYVKIRNHVITMTVVLTAYIPYCSYLVEMRNNYQGVLASIPVMFFITAFIVKNYVTYIKSKVIDKVLYAIKRDFENYSGEDLKILHDYSKSASKINNCYTVCMLMVTGGYGVVPVSLYLMDTFMPLNETRLVKPRPMTYHIDYLDNNYLFMALHGVITDYIAIIFMTGFDVLCLSISYHACARFLIIAEKIRRMVNTTLSNINTYENQSKDTSYRELVKIIIMHQNALEFAQAIGSTFNLLNLISIGFATLPMIIMAYEMSKSKGDVGEIMQYLSFVIAEFIYIFLYNWHGQKITDHSLMIYQACYQSEWYNEEFSVKSRKIMNLMILRSQKPCYITVGNIYVLGYPYFATVMKLAWSMFTVLSSVS